MAEATDTQENEQTDADTAAAETANSLALDAALEKHGVTIDTPPAVTDTPVDEDAQTSAKTAKTAGKAKTKRAKKTTSGDGSEAGDDGEAGKVAADVDPKANEGEADDDTDAGPKLSRRQREAARLAGLDPVALGDEAAAILERIANMRSDESRAQQGLTPKYAALEAGQTDDPTSRATARFEGQADDAGQGDGRPAGDGGQQGQANADADGDGVLTAEDLIYSPEKVIAALQELKAENARLSQQMGEVRSGAEQTELDATERAIDGFFEGLDAQLFGELYGEGASDALHAGSDEMTGRNELVALAVSYRSAGTPLAKALEMANYALNKEAVLEAESRGRREHRRSTNKGSMPPPGNRRVPAKQLTGTEAAAKAMDEWGARNGIAMTD